MSNPVSRRGRPPHPDTLTPSEWTVLHLVRHGLTNQQIARMRRTTTDAVKFHVRNIASKAGVSGRSQLRQWGGVPATLRARDNEEFKMTTTQLGIQNIAQVSLYIQDVERANAFYRDALGLQYLFTFGNLTFFDCGGVRLYLSIPEQGEWRPGSVLYFRVPDIHAAHETLTARGVAFESAPHLIHRHESGMEEWMAFFHDSEGNMLALSAQIPPP
jgi:DNA-binding CsgD family transcriptional regulator/catechol 2,3-dioxygenase-like lactoylglutathione lyase family enzyme